MPKPPIETLFVKNSKYTIYEFLSIAIPYYYSNSKIFGKEGDFITAPEISQIFGELIGIYFACNWQNMGCPENINIVEFGAGKATLMKDFLRGTKNVKNFHKNINIHIIETSESLINIQKSELSDFKVKWHKDISSIPNEICFYIANEFFDALPIKQYIFENNKWYELGVAFNETFKASRYKFELSQILQDHIKKRHKSSKSGDILEINQASISIIQKIAKRVKNNGGGALFIDYGYLNSNYKDTLQAVKNHKYHHIFDDIGEADITSHVDFNSLIDVIKDQEITEFYYNTQREFLLSLGITERKDALINSINEFSLRSEINSSVKRLIDKSEMGDLFKVLSFFKW